MSYPIIPALSLVGQIAPAPYVDRYARVLGAALGPDAVTTAQAMAGLGYLWTYADLLEECRGRDSHLQGILQRRELRVAGASWEMRAAPESGELGAEIARFCDARLREMESDGSFGRSFATMVADMQGAVYHGRSGHEMLWRVEGRDLGGEWWMPRTAEWIHPRRFAMATDWALHIWDSSGTGESALTNVNTRSPFGNFPGVSVAAVNAIAPGKLVAHAPRITGSIPTREGIGYVTVWPACFKRMGVREFVAFIAWAARGLKKGTFDAAETPGGGGGGASRDNEAKLYEAAVNWSAQNAAILPSTCKLEVETVEGHGEAQQRFIDWCNSEMSKAVLGSTLGTDAGQRGARSLGEVHERGEEALALNDARTISETLRSMLLRPLVRMNFGDRAAVPSIVFDVGGAADLTALSERMERFVRLGGKITQEDARNLLAFPDPKEGDTDLLTITSGPRGGSIGSAPPGAAPNAVKAPAVPAVAPPAPSPPEDAAAPAEAP